MKTDTKLTDLSSQTKLDSNNNCRTFDDREKRIHTGSNQQMENVHQMNDEQRGFFTFKLTQATDSTWLPK